MTYYADRAAAALPRPLIIAIGVHATADVRAGHEDLVHADVLLVPTLPSSAVLAAWRDAGTFARVLTVCLFDDRDEMLWRVLKNVITVARSYSAIPLWLVLAQRNGAYSHQRLHQLATLFECCVIDTGRQRLLDTALAPIASLYVGGLTGFQPPDLGDVAEVGSVAYVTTYPPVPSADIVDAVVVMRCYNDIELAEIEGVHQHVADAFAGALPLIATPWCDTPQPSSIPTPISVFAFPSVTQRRRDTDA